ncbi:replication initiator protein [Sigmofec virus UA08Rod_6044]|uniref:Replication initiator protein n=1 Tax=Sigmofec virus UA08Rod_6044 TaxID=2929448 RepID=A0A976N0F9_9VIRU|nr:replication initiator protein [Sigmofec virus UA08Rod_6044]
MCTNPITIYINKEEYKVPCGKCPTCRRQKAQEWAIKLINEAKYHEKASFITLTFDNKILLDKNSKAVKMGANPSFVFNTEYSMKYFTKFIKRLRKKFNEKSISYFHVAEYGEKTKRPHHHAIIFGINFEEDRKVMELSKTGHIQYYSKTLEDLWACGRTSIQDLNSNNVIYICQYSIKKFKQSEEKYKAKMTFSNRKKMNCKFIRNFPENITKGYLNDNEGKKYKIPKSYISEIKKEPKFEKYYNKYIENRNNYFNKSFYEERLKNEKNREEILKRRQENLGKMRDF